MAWLSDILKRIPWPGRAVSREQDTSTPVQDPDQLQRELVARRQKWLKDQMRGFKLQPTSHWVGRGPDGRRQYRWPADAGVTPDQLQAQVQLVVTDDTSPEVAEIIEIGGEPFRVVLVTSLPDRRPTFSSAEHLVELDLIRITDRQA